MLVTHFTNDAQGKNQGKTGFFGESSEGRAEKLMTLKGGFLISPDDRKIAPNERYVMMVGYDAMNVAKNRVPSREKSEKPEILAISTLQHVKLH